MASVAVAEAERERDFGHYYYYYYYYYHCYCRSGYLLLVCGLRVAAALVVHVFCALIISRAAAATGRWRRARRASGEPSTTPRPGPRAEFGARQIARSPAWPHASWPNRGPSSCGCLAAESPQQWKSPSDRHDRNINELWLVLVLVLVGAVLCPFGRPASSVGASYKAARLSGLSPFSGPVLIGRASWARKKFQPSERGPCEGKRQNWLQPPPGWGPADKICSRSPSS